MFLRRVINFYVGGTKSQHNYKCFTQNQKTCRTFEDACTASDKTGLDTIAATLSVFNLAPTQVFLYPLFLKM